MNAENKDYVEIIQECLREVADEEGIELPEVNGETTIFGEDGLLDSAALVSLVVAVEERIDEQMGVAISLADERAMSQKRSPFQSIATLADYSRLRVDEDPNPFPIACH